jgi:hypothetical protein
VLHCSSSYFIICPCFLIRPASLFLFLFHYSSLCFIAPPPTSQFFHASSFVLLHCSSSCFITLLCASLLLLLLHSSSMLPHSSCFVGPFLIWLGCCTSWLIVVLCFTLLLLIVLCCCCYFDVDPCFTATHASLLLLFHYFYHLLLCGVSSLLCTSLFSYPPKYLYTFYYFIVLPCFVVAQYFVVPLPKFVLLCPPFYKVLEIQIWNWLGGTLKATKLQAANKFFFLFFLEIVFGFLSLIWF